NLRPVVGVVAGSVGHFVDVMVLIDRRHGYETLASLGQCDLHRSGIKVEHCFRIKRVAVWAHAWALKRQVAQMNELAERSALDELGEIHVGLGASEVVSRDRHGIVGWGLCLSHAEAAGQQEACESRSFHCSSVTPCITSSSSTSSDCG